LKTEVNLPTVSNKKIILFFVGILKTTEAKSRIRIKSNGMDLDPYDNATDLEHCRSK
jgi:hypothetical protein